MYDSSAAKPTVLVVGEVDRADFRQALETMRSSVPLVSIATIEQALTWFATLNAESDLALPDVVIVAQSWPGQFTTQVIDRLRRAAPLLRILSLAGTWCDGESRTGNPWLADFRASWHQWPARFQEQLEQLAGGNCPAWGLPITMADDERLLWNADFDSPGGQGLVAIQAPQGDMARLLADACRHAGYETVFIEPGSCMPATGAAAGIWDATSCDPSEIAELRNFATALADVPLIALLGFPRAEDCQRVVSAGAAAVLSKPLLLDDLCQELTRLTSHKQVTAVPAVGVL